MTNEFSQKLSTRDFCKTFDLRAKNLTTSCSRSKSIRLKQLNIFDIKQQLDLSNLNENDRRNSVLDRSFENEYILFRATERFSRVRGRNCLRRRDIILHLATELEKIDPINSDCLEKPQKWTPIYFNFDRIECEYVMNYINRLFTVSVLQNEDYSYDHMIGAVISYILYFDLRAVRTEFRKINSAYESIVDYLECEIKDDQIYVYNNAPFIKSPIKVAFAYIKRTLFTPFHNKNPREEIIGKYVKPTLLVHLYEIYKLLLNENLIDTGALNKLNKKFSKFKYLQNIPQCYLDHGENQLSTKFITGTSCVGKSTLLEKSKEYNYVSRSRGEIGSFEKKKSSASSIAALHAAQEFALSQPFIIGGRYLLFSFSFSIRYNVLLTIRPSFFVRAFIMAFQFFPILFFSR